MKLTLSLTRRFYDTIRISLAQQMHDYVNYPFLCCEQVPKSIAQLGRYGLPVMVSHFKFWQEGHAENPGAQVTARFVQEYLTGESLRKLYADGLRYWVFMAEVAETDFTRYPRIPAGGLVPAHPLPLPFQHGPGRSRRRSYRGLGGV